MNFLLLKKKAQKYFSDFKAESFWSAQDCISLDGIPYIGRFVKSNPNVFVATGFNKWGMTSAMVSANIISDMICGNRRYENSVFSPSRFSLSASSKNICKNMAETICGFSGYLGRTTIKAKDIECETAGIIN